MAWQVVVLSYRGTMSEEAFVGVLDRKLELRLRFIYADHMQNQSRLKQEKVVYKGRGKELFT